MRVVNYNINNLIQNSFLIKNKDKIILIYDNTTKNIVKYFKKAIKKKSNKEIKLLKVKVSKIHGKDFSIQDRKIIKNYNLILCLTKYSYAHSKTRLDLIKSARFASMPGYSLKLLKNPALGYNFKKSDKVGKKLKKIFDNGKIVEIFSNNNKYKSVYYIKNRIANYCPGYINKNGDLGSPPDSEINISPQEFFSNGKILIRDSVAVSQIGKIKNSFTIDLKDGYIESVSSKNKNLEKKIKNLFTGNKKKRICAEIGIGLNSKSKVTGNMLTDEGAKGHLHLGFGSNFTVGGKNKIDFHVDLVTSNLEVFVDKRKIIKNNNFLIN